MRTILLANQKGGTGKTTLAVNLAVAFTRGGKNVVVLDLDPQASAAEWGDARDSEFPHVQSIQPSRLPKTMKQLQEIGTDVVILDTAPHSEATILDAIRIADLILIPCQPSIVDLRAMGKTIGLVKMGKTPAFAVLNNVQHHSLTTAAEAEKTIEEHLGLTVCPVRIGARVAYSRAMITGQTPQETDQEGKASQEIGMLLGWTTKQLAALKVAA